jgi:hypothetical protein
MQATKRSVAASTARSRGAFARPAAPGPFGGCGQWLACMLPCQRFTNGLTAARAWLGADVEWTALWLGSTGMIGPDTLALFLIGLPTLAVGTSAALKLFGKLND